LNETGRHKSHVRSPTIGDPANPPNKADFQDDRWIFKIAAELRDHIYALAFVIETNEDGGIKLDGDRKPPSKALTVTCQRIHKETREMCRTAYRDYPNHTFTIDIEIRPLPPEIPALLNGFLPRIN
jgi:hypothetical protein